MTDIERQKRIEFYENLTICLAVGLAKKIKAPPMSLADEQYVAKHACPQHIESARWQLFIKNILEE